MSTNEFNMMKAGATFISLGRGSAVDETALAIALGASRSNRLLQPAIPHARGSMPCVDLSTALCL